MSPAPTINDLIDVFETGSILSLFVGGVLLLLVSQKAVINRPACERWGLRVGVLAFIGWYFRDLMINGLWGADQFFLTGLRALLVLFYSTTVSWLLFSVASCLPARNQPAWLSRFTIRPQVIDPPEQPNPSPLPPTPEQEREQHRLAAVAEAERQQQLAEQAERDQTRLDVELLYDRYRAELQDKFPPERFDVYFDRYLTSDLEPTVYAERAEKLKDMIRERLNVRHTAATPQFTTVEEIVRHFQARKAALQSLGLDAHTLETLEITFDEMQDREVRRLLTD